MVSEKRTFKMDVGTFGSLRCEKSLNSIIMETKDPELLNVVSKRYHGFRNGVAAACSVKEKRFAEVFLHLWLDKTLYQIGCSRKIHEWSDILDSHLRCCVVTRFRIALNELHKKVKPI